MNKFKVKYNNKVYKVRANDSAEAVKKVVEYINVKDFGGRIKDGTYVENLNEIKSGKYTVILTNPTKGKSENITVFANSGREAISLAMRRSRYPGNVYSSGVYFKDSKNVKDFDGAPTNRNSNEYSWFFEDMTSLNRYFDSLVNKKIKDKRVYAWINDRESSVIFSPSSFKYDKEITQKDLMNAYNDAKNSLEILLKDKHFIIVGSPNYSSSQNNLSIHIKYVS